MKFFCYSCGQLVPMDQMNLDAEYHRVCHRCYVADPPAADIDGVFAEVAARFRREGGARHG